MHHHINDTGGKFATSVNNIGSKFSTSFASVVVTGGKINKILMIEDFFNLSPVSTLSFKYHREFSKKFKTALMVHILRGLGETD